MYEVHVVHVVHGSVMPKRDNLASSRLDYRDLERIEAIMYRDERSRSYVIKKAVKLGLDALEKAQGSSSATSSSSSSSSSKARGRR